MALEPIAPAGEDLPPHKPCGACGGVPVGVAAVVLAIAVFAVYYHALDVPLFFDDIMGIKTNESIVSLWPIIGSGGRPGPLNPTPGLPSSGRPLVNLSFALNYAIDGADPVGYHAVNVVIHILSALFVWAIARRTLLMSLFSGRFQYSAGWLALATAMLWSLHPLQTEAVIYATQRTELMMALFYLATLYCSLRYFLALPPGEGRGEGGLQRWDRMAWLLLAVVACLCGMASKEVMVSAPLMVLLYERTFVAGSLAKALRRSWPLYAALAPTWLLLLALNIGAPRGNTAGFGLGPPTIAWWLTQSQVLLMYLKLVVWPWPLLIHYHLPYLETVSEAWVYVIPVAILGFTTLVLLWRNKPLGFLGCWVFAILTPTSVVPVLTEMAAERRMYLPLVAFAVLFVVMGYVLVQAVWRPASRVPPKLFGLSVQGLVTAVPVLVVALVLGLVSAKRLGAYNDELNLWHDVLDDQPKNYWAHINLGILLTKLNRLQEAVKEIQTAVASKPDNAVALNNIGVAFMQCDRCQDAVAPFQAALRLAPDDGAMHQNLGKAFLHSGHLPEAIDEIKAAIALNSEDAMLHNNLAAVLTQAGQFQEAIEHCQEALRLRPDDFDAHHTLGAALLHAGRLPEAIAELRAALALKPDDPTALNTLGAALLQLGQFPEAAEHIQRALQLRPNYTVARNNLGQAFAGTGQIPEAIEQFRLATEQDERFAGAQISWAHVLAAQDKFDESIGHFQKAIELGADQPDVHNSLGDSYRKNGKTDQAIEQYQIAVRLNAAYMQAYANLAQTLALVDRSKEAVAISEKAIEVARSTGQPDELGQFEEWLKHYQIELRRAAEAATPVQSPPPTLEQKQTQ